MWVLPLQNYGNDKVQMQSQSYRLRVIVMFPRSTNISPPYSSLVVTRPCEIVDCKSLRVTCVHPCSLPTQSSVAVLCNPRLTEVYDRPTQVFWYHFS